MSIWRATKARRVLRRTSAPRLGFSKKQVGSHRKLQRKKGGGTLRSRYTTMSKVGPAALNRIAKDTGLSPEDL